MAWHAHEDQDVIRMAVAVVRIDDTDWGLDVARDDVREALDTAEESLETLFSDWGLGACPADHEGRGRIDRSCAYPS